MTEAIESQRLLAHAPVRLALAERWHVSKYRWRQRAARDLAGVRASRRSPGMRPTVARGGSGHRRSPWHVDARPQRGACPGT